MHIKVSEALAQAYSTIRETVIYQAPIESRDSANAFMVFEPLNKNISKPVRCIHQEAFTR